MLALLALSALGQEGLLSKVVPHPTGQNGYEEYLAAADLVTGTEFDEYQNCLVILRGYSGNSQIGRPQDVSEADPDLTVRSKMVAKYDRSLSLLAAGNRKPVYDPRRGISPETTFPEFTYFKRLAKLEGAAAHVSFALGDTGTAITHIQDGFVFGSRISESSFIAYLVGQASQAIVFGELDDHWPQLSVTDAADLKAFFAARLDGPEPLQAALKSEEKLALGAINDIFDKPEMASSVFTGDQAGIAEEIEKLSGADIRSLRDAAAGDVVKQFDTASQILSGPESGWLTGKGLEFSDQPDDPTDRLDRRIANYVTPAMSQLLFFAERARNHERLDYLSARAVEFRWVNGHLPAKIEDFTTPTERIDPSTGKPFHYQLDGEWFLIIREGADQLGRVTSGPQHKLPSAPTPPISDDPK